jgi:hypothetical protein
MIARDKLVQRKIKDVTVVEGFVLSGTCKIHTQRCAVKKKEIFASERRLFSVTDVDATGEQKDLDLIVVNASI